MSTAGGLDGAHAAGDAHGFRHWRHRARLRVCDEVGRGLRLFGDPYVRNPGSMRVGRGVVLYSRPVRLHLVTGANGSLAIGDDVVIGHGAGLTAYHDVVVGDGTVIGPYAMVLDTDFHHIVQRRAPGATGTVRIGRNVLVGAWAMILRGADIGDGACIAPGSIVRGRVDAGARVEGVPARAVSRAAGDMAWPAGGLR